MRDSCQILQLIADRFYKRWQLATENSSCKNSVVIEVSKATATHGLNVMRFLLAGVGILAALVFMAASAAMNWVFLKSLGKTELEGQIFGAFSVALDVTKSLLPLFIGWAAMAKRHVYRTIASGVFLLLFVFALAPLSALRR